MRKVTSIFNARNHYEKYKLLIAFHSSSDSINYEIMFVPILVSLSCVCGLKIARPDGQKQLLLLVLYTHFSAFQILFQNWMRFAKENLSQSSHLDMKYYVYSLEVLRLSRISSDGIETKVLNKFSFSAGHQNCIVNNVLSDQ